MKYIVFEAQYLTLNTSLVVSSTSNMHSHLGEVVLKNVSVHVFLLWGAKKHFFPTKKRFPPKIPTNAFFVSSQSPISHMPAADIPSLVDA